MKRPALHLFGTILIALTASCAHNASPSETAASASGRATDSAPHSGSIFFFQASKPGKPGTVFILGSAHMRHDKATIDKAITDAAATCERGTFEIDLDTVDNTEVAAFVQREGMLHGKTLRDVISPETYAAWLKAVEARHLPREPMEKMQPWMAAMMLGVSSLEQGGVNEDGTGSGAISGNEGVDKMLYAFERNEPSRKRTITGLETATEQLMLFQKVSHEGQDRMLRAASIGAVHAGSAKVIELYEAGDEAGLVQMFDAEHKGEPDELTQAVFDRRNISMTEKISAMFDAPGCNVVTVGAAHVVGSRGIVHRLEEKGFSLRRVASLGATDAARMAFTVTAPKEFVSNEDGFSVLADHAPVKQEMPDKKTRIYAFGEGTMSAITVSIHDLPPGVPRARLDPLLDKATADALTRAGLEITKTDTVLVQGERVPRVTGVAKGASQARRGMNVTVVHGDRLYMIMSLQMDEANPKKLDDAFDAFLGTFRLR